MTDEADRLARLRALGLSDSAARAYVALLELGATDARSVSRLARVPTSKVYQALEQLHERGLAEVTPTTPKQYVPRPVTHLIDGLREQHVEAAQALARQRAEYEALFPAEGGRTLGDKGRVRVLRGRREIMRAIRQMMEDTRESLVVAPGEGWSLRTVPHQPAWEAAHKRGVKLRAILQPRPPQDPGGRLMAATAEVRVLAEPREVAKPVTIVCFDAERAVLIHFVPGDGRPDEGQDIAVVIEERAIAARLQSQLEACWARAAPPGPARERKETPSGF